jgi:hypothetical protein
MKNWKPLKWLSGDNSPIKAGLLTALLLLTFCQAFAQQYFNHLYTEGLSNSNVLVLLDGYFLPAQTVNSNGLVSLLSLKMDQNGQILLVDTFTINNYDAYSGSPGSTNLNHQKIYHTGTLQDSPTNALGIFFKISNYQYQELGRYKYQDSITSIFRSSTITQKQNIQAVGEVFVYTGGIPDYQFQLLLMQLDTLGNKLWERSFAAKSGLQHLQGNSILSTKDGSFVVGGIAFNNYGIFPSYTSYVMLADSLGNKVHERYLKFENYGNYSMDLTELPNGNFLVVYGTTYKSFPASEHQSRKLIVSELDKNDLSTIWERDYLEGYLNDLNVSGLIPQNDSTYLISGTYHPDYYFYEGEYAIRKGYIFAINSQGDSLWYRDFSSQTDSSEENYLNDIAVTQDGGIVGTGRLFTPKSPFTGGLANHVWLFKTDSIGCLYPGCDTVYIQPEPPKTFNYSVHPNPWPSSTDLTIKIPGAVSGLASLYNSMGQLVLQQNLDFENGIARFSPSLGMAPGCYFLHLQDQNGRVYKEKLILN